MHSDLDLSSFSGPGVYNPKPLPHLGPMLTFGANFEQIYSGGLQVQDAKCHRIKPSRSLRRNPDEVEYHDFF